MYVYIYIYIYTLCMYISIYIYIYIYIYINDLPYDTSFFSIVNNGKQLQSIMNLERFSRHK